MPDAGNTPPIKREEVTTPGLLKPEPMDYEDDELYEDAGDLDMTHGDDAVWLVKLPSFVAERWNEIEEEEEICLGYIKVRANDQTHVCDPGNTREKAVCERRGCWLQD